MVAEFEGQMINREKQIKNTVIYVVPKIITGFLPIVTLPIFTRILTVTDYGVFALAEIYGIFVSGVVNFGLTTSYERNFFQYIDKKKSAELFYSTLFFVLINFLAASVVTFIFKNSIALALVGSIEYGRLLFWVFLSTVMMGFKQYFLIYFKNTELAKDFAIYTLDETLLGVVMSMFFVVYLKSGIVGLAWGQCLASFVILLVLIVKFIKIMPICFNWEVLKDSLSISLPLTPRIFVGVVSTQFNKYILKLLNTAGGVGVFSMAQRIANVSFIVMTTFQNVFNPQVYKKMFSGELSAGKEIGEYLSPFIYFSIFICLLISLFSGEIVRLLTVPSFYGAAPIVSILSMYYGFLFFGKINGIQLIYKKKIFLISMFTFADIGFSLIISIPLIIKFGAVGAALATLLGGFITGTVAFIVSQNYFRIHWELKKIVTIFSVFCISSLLALLFLLNFVAYPMGLTIRIFCVFVYMFLGVKFCILSSRNLNLLWNVVTFRKAVL